MRFVSLVCAAGAVLAAGAASAESITLDAHEHGVSRMNVAIFGGAVSIELLAPGADVVGFEYEPESAEDKAAVEAALATLRDGAAVFQPSPAAGCRFTKATAELVIDDPAKAKKAGGGHDHDHGHSHDHDHGHGDEHSATHSEFQAAYELTCDDPGELTTIDTTFFDLFETAGKLAAVVVTETAQASRTATRDAPRIALRGGF